MNDQQMNIRHLAEIISRQRKTVYLVFAAAISIAFLFNIFSTPVYEANVSLRIKSWTSEATRTTFPEELSRQQLYTYAEIVKSRTVVEGVINKLYPADEDRPDYEKMAKRIRLQPVRESEILNIYAQADSPQEAQNVANTVFALFNEHLTNMVRSEGKEARTFLAQRVAEAKRNLEKMETEMVEFKKSKQTVAISDQTRSFIERQSALKKIDMENMLMLDTAQSRLANINEQIARQNPGFIADSSTIQQYRNKLAEQEVELVALRNSYTALHPKIVALQAAINETKAKLDAEITKVVKSEAPSSNPVYQAMLQNKLQAEVEVAVGQAQRGAIARAVAASDSELKTLPDKEQGLARLMRDYAVAEESYTTLAKRYDQARIDEVMQPTNVQVVDMAGLPEKSVKPRKVLNLLVAALLGLLGGLLGALLVDHFCKTIDTSQDIRRYLGINIIGSIPNPERCKESRSFIPDLAKK